MFVVELKFAYLMQWGQANQNFGIWSRLMFIAGPAKETEWIVSKTWTPGWLCGKNFYKQNLAEVCRVWTFLWLVSGELTAWCSSNLNHQPSGSKLLDSMCLCSARSYHLLPWVRLLLLWRDIYQIFIHIPGEEMRTLPHHCTIGLFLFFNICLLGCIWSLL